MRLSADRRFVVLIAIIALLLPALALLQYRWLGELSDLEQLRARTNIQSAARRFSTDFDVLLANTYAGFHRAAGPAGAPLDPITLARALPPSGIVQEVWVVDRLATGAYDTRELDAGGREVSRGGWPAWLAAPDTLTIDTDDDARHQPGLHRTLLDEVPAIVVHRADDRAERWVVARLDLTLIATQLLPSMLEGHFSGGIPVSYDVLINREDVPDDVVYRSRAELTRHDFDDWVSLMPVFAIHSRDLDATIAEGLMADAAAHRWRLFIKPQSGALEAAVATARTRNLAIGIGVLAFLAVSVGLLVVSMHSVQRAQRHQLELVARISHELRTPLATITCAGENLADNLVDTAADAQHYGQLIKREGRRLTKTLGDILLCCRLQARPDEVLSLRPTDVGVVIADAIGDSAIIAAERGVSIDSSIEPDLPLVLADHDALKMAIKNLLVNAIKYGDGQPVQIAARLKRSATGAEVCVLVDDRGPGIAPDELSRIFEPFYRGRSARALEIDGSGIGLSIVSQVAHSHRGRVRVSSGERRGTRFSLQLPAMKGESRLPVDPAA